MPVVDEYFYHFCWTAFKIEYGKEQSYHTFNHNGELLFIYSPTTAASWSRMHCQNSSFISTQPGRIICKTIHIYAEYIHKVGATGLIEQIIVNWKFTLLEKIERKQEKKDMFICRCTLLKWVHFYTSHSKYIRIKI